MKMGLESNQREHCCGREVADIWGEEQDLFLRSKRRGRHSLPGILLPRFILELHILIRILIFEWT